MANAWNVTPKMNSQKIVCSKAWKYVKYKLFCDYNSDQLNRNNEEEYIKEQ